MFSSDKFLVTSFDEISNNNNIIQTPNNNINNINNINTKGPIYRYDSWIEQSFNGTPKFNKKITSTICKNGLGIDQMIITITLPDLPDGLNYKKVCVYELLKYIDLRISGSTFMKFNSIQMKMFDLVMRNFKNIKKFAEIKNNIIQYPIDLKYFFKNSTYNTDLSNNLPFDFNGFRLCDSSMNELTLNVEFNSIHNIIDNCTNLNLNLFDLNALELIDVVLLVHYVGIENSNILTNNSFDKTSNTSNKFVDPYLAIKNRSMKYENQNIINIDGNNNNNLNVNKNFIHFTDMIDVETVIDIENVNDNTLNNNAGNYIMKCLNNLYSLIYPPNIKNNIEINKGPFNNMCNENKQSLVNTDTSTKLESSSIKNVPPVEIMIKQQTFKWHTDLDEIVNGTKSIKIRLCPSGFEISKVIFHSSQLNKATHFSFQLNGQDYFERTNIKNYKKIYEYNNNIKLDDDIFVIDVIIKPHMDVIMCCFSFDEPCDYFKTDIIYQQEMKSVYVNDIFIEHYNY